MTNRETVEFRKVKQISSFDFGAWRQTVATRYIGSEFMGRSIVEDVLQAFLAGISDLHQSKILKVAPNGPKVDLLFLKFLAE